MLKEFSVVPNESQDKPPICDTQPEIESDFDEFIYHPYIDFNFDEDINDDLTNDQDDALGDDIVESSTPIFFPKSFQ